VSARIISRIARSDRPGSSAREPWQMLRVVNSRAKSLCPEHLTLFCAQATEEAVAGLALAETRYPHRPTFGPFTVSGLPASCPKPWRQYVPAYSIQKVKDDTPVPDNDVMFQVRGRSPAASSGQLRGVLQ
jgi:hypothetical protein